jgi:hypothetical protein
MKRTLLIIGIVLLALVSGFYQEKIKISVNYLLERGDQIPGYYQATPEQRQQWIEQTRLDTPFDYYHNHQTVSWLYNLNRSELNKLKWGITVFFMGWFLMINWAALYALNARLAAGRVLALSYLSMSIIAIILFLAGRGGSLEVHTYALSRKILGALQSIVPAMIIWPASVLWQQTKSSKPS